MTSALGITSTAKTFRVAIVGVGLVGAELVRQLQALQPSPFRLVALSSSKSLLFHPDSLSPSQTQTQAANWDWKAELASSGRKADMQVLLRELAAMVRPGQEAVLVDNTSSNEVAALYPSFLRLGVHVVTPNKKAFSGELALYEQILTAGLEGGAKFLNEATVGAGLPVISTLNDLVATGDQVTKIEGVFSGTMSYIFNEFSTGKEGGPSFSSVVRGAREKGYTEPHPADDLNGADVARKLTILSRLIPSLRSALPAGYQSVSTRSLIPPELEGIASGDEFIRRLPEFDAQFDNLRAEAIREGQVLRYAGVVDVETGTIKADLEKYPVTHPFATALGGSDNIIMFHTARYGVRPLVVQGAGAGAAVTAMGVMSDLLKLV
ncbi:aspartate kinase homoserine dehydrogenase [Ganoderma leucocontextum]|nr:aspartate kinase homoserine dehydrogenase [Ganoderma leucocontextum]